MSGLLHDLRFALRMLLKSPGYTIVAVFTLAVAIGANTAIFSAVNSMLLRPLPFPAADRLAYVIETLPDTPEVPVSYLNWKDYRDQNTSFSALAVAGVVQVDLSGKGEPERLHADIVSRDLLPVLGAEPALGRNFLPEEDAPGGPRSVLLYHGLWTRRFAADPAILGKTLTLDGEPWTVVGVMPPGFKYIYEQSEILLPIGARADTPHYTDRNVRTGLFPLGRLKDGVTLEQAAADIAAVSADIARRFPANHASVKSRLLTLPDAIAESYRAGLLLLMGAVVCVLLIAVANVANLMLERAMTRQREMGIRAALGAGRWRLVRQLLVESVLLALAAAGLGLLVALWGVDLLTALRPDGLGISVFGPITVDTTVLVFTAAIALGTGLLFGLVPAIYASRQDLAQALKDADHHATAGGRHLRARNLLVVLEVALALALLVSAVLAVRGLSRLQAIDPGFDHEHLLFARLAPPQNRFKTVAEARQFWSEVRRRLAEIPGVESATVANGAPIVGSHIDLLNHVGEPPGLATGRLAASYIADEHFIATLKIPLLAGRTFGPQDVPGSPPTIILDRAAAEAFFPGQDPVGQRIQDRLSERPGIEVIGVADHVLHFPPDIPTIAPYQMYYAYAQLPESALPHIVNASLILRTRGDPHTYAAQVRATIADLDPDLPVHAVTTLAETIATTLSMRRFTSTLLGAFAGLALALAAVGLYAVMAGTVAQRTHELGVRMALGAQPRAVVALVVRQGMTLVGLGVALGLLGALGLTHLLAATLPSDLGPTDPLTYSVVTAILVVVGLLATYIPARRATHIDPMVALRHE